MTKHSVYILTDSNRSYLKVGYSNDLNTTMNELRQASPSLFPNSPKLTNLVHIEVYDSLDQAERRAAQLMQFTRMQRERLIRFKNPNWLNQLPCYNAPASTVTQVGLVRYK
ncbi:GIY-YIG nuclease family protein [Sphingobacterium sp. MYb382]|uniref:GIY-YIG nuclease family protein n=1 Tax=Sphingobacterium sp. MYb382 TaxID=2745278 RepID=UPI0030AD6D0D